MDFGSSNRNYTNCREISSSQDAVPNCDTRFFSVESQNPYRFSFRVPDSSFVVPQYEEREQLMYSGTNVQEIKSPYTTGVCNRGSYRKVGIDLTNHLYGKDEFPNISNYMPDVSSTSDDLRRNYGDQELSAEASNILYRTQNRKYHSFPQGADPINSVEPQNPYKHSNLTKKTTFIKNKDAVFNTSCRRNRPVGSQQQKQYAEKTTYCRPVLSLYNQQYIYKYSPEKSKKLQGLVRKLAEAREREKQNEAWNNYINELKHKHGCITNKAKVPYIPNKPPVTHFIEDCYNTRYAPTDSNRTKNLLDDIYGTYSSKHLKQKCLITRGTNPDSPNSLPQQVTLPTEYKSLYGNEAICYPSASQGGLQMLKEKGQLHHCRPSYSAAGRNYHGNTIIAETKYPRPTAKYSKNTKLCSTKTCDCDCNSKDKSSKKYFKNRQSDYGKSKIPFRDIYRPSRASKTLPEESSEKRIDELTHSTSDDYDGDSTGNKNRIYDKKYDNDDSDKTENKDKEKNRNERDSQYDDENMTKKMTVSAGKKDDEIKSIDIKEEIVKISDNVARLKEKNDSLKDDSAHEVFRSIDYKLDLLVRAVNALVVEMNSRPPPATKCTLTECTGNKIGDKDLVANSNQSTSPPTDIRTKDSTNLYENCCKKNIQDQCQGNEGNATQDSTIQTSRVCTLPNCTKTKCVAKKQNSENKSTANQNSEDESNPTKNKFGFSNSDDVVCAIVSRPRPCIPFSDVFRERNNAAKLDKILLEEIGKSDRAKRDIAEILGNPRMKISFELPTKERSTEVTASFSKGLLNPAVTQTVFAQDRHITIAVNTDPLSLLALIKVSTESIRQLLSHLAMLQFAPVQAPAVTHRKREATFICNICGDVFYNPSQLSQHIKEHNLGNTR